MLVYLRAFLMFNSQKSTEVVIYSRMVKCFVLLLFLVFCDKIESDQVHNQPKENDVKELVEQWSKQLGKELYRLSSTMTRRDKIFKSFQPLKDKIYYADGNQLIGDVACDLRYMMDKKLQAVGRIAEYAEFLSYYRKKPNEPFDYYSADNITSTESGEIRVRELEEELSELECTWWCDQKDLKPLDNNIFTKEEIAALFNTKCDCSDRLDRTREEEYYRELPLEKHPSFGDTPVNLNLSVVKVATNIYYKDPDVLEGVRWSEPLDLVFKRNWEQDKTLQFQYFASPYGYMRHFPAIKWSDERYAKTYDPRTRSWYTEAMTSPKDIIILLDRSGSVFKRKRKIAAQIVNDILDTLNDNDFVNIYTFTNTAEPLVSCFTDTLVQANEENLRLLRENLETYESKFAANVTKGLEKAFQILEDFRLNKNGSSQCNQAIMLITEAVYYDSKQVFQQYNWRNDTPVRVFTYELETDEEDARILEFMACSNKGYFANVSLMEEIREKVLPYLNVMSRPVNLNINRKQVPIWSYLYVDLADRRYTNWLWKKVEGIRQREIFLDHAKREFIRLNKVLTSESHFLLEESHEYQKYKTRQTYDYMTTISLPVYGRRKEDVDLIGVAGVDIPIKLLKSLVPHHILGVNGYAFIVTNNGYILMHPGHRPEFENITKPTFNRVDLLEVEILEADNESRVFGPEIIKFREDIVKKQMGEVTLNIKYALDDMKRIILSKRKYFYTHLGPFKFGIALPDKYGLMIVNSTEVTYQDFGMGLLKTLNWSVHPDWVYCKFSTGKTPEEYVSNCLQQRLKDNKEETQLFASLLFDAKATIWFEEEIPNSERLIENYLVDNVFLSTHSGLTRWKTFEHDMKQRYNIEKGEREYFWGARSIDGDWYKRAVDENFNNKDEEMFIYSAPFETSGYEYDNLITSTKAIFVNVTGKKTPVAVVGLQFNYLSSHKLYTKITGNDECFMNKQNACYSCNSDYLECFVLDNNAYVIFSDEEEYTGRYIGDLFPEITALLLQNGVYKETIMFDYQAICQKPAKLTTKSAAPSTLSNVYRKIIENLFQLIQWVMATFLFLVNSVIGGPKYESTRNETLAYERLEINKTVPTPCDQKMWLYTLKDRIDTVTVGYSKDATRDKCPWAYIVRQIPQSNLLFMAVNQNCQLKSISSYHSPTPVEATDYNESLACYITNHNTFARRSYMECHTKHEFEETLKKDRAYCGHTWKP